jgi:hypothetical protein
MVDHAPGIDIFHCFERHAVTLLLLINPGGERLFHHPATRAFEPRGHCFNLLREVQRDVCGQHFCLSRHVHHLLSTRLKYNRNRLEKQGQQNGLAPPYGTAALSPLRSDRAPDGSRPCRVTISMAGWRCCAVRQSAARIVVFPICGDRARLRQPDRIWSFLSPSMGGRRFL